MTEEQEEQNADQEKPMPIYSQPADNIHEALIRASLEIGVIKKQKARGLGYSVVLFEDVVPRARRALANHQVSMHNSDIDHMNYENRKDNKGNMVNAFQAVYHFQFTHAPSGTHITIAVPSQAADYSDKAPFKATTMAEKYAYYLALRINRSDDPDKERIEFSDTGKANNTTNKATSNSSQSNGRAASNTNGKPRAGVFEIWKKNIEGVTDIYRLFNAEVELAKIENLGQCTAEQANQLRDLMEKKCCQIVEQVQDHSGGESIRKAVNRATKEGKLTPKQGTYWLELVNEQMEQIQREANAEAAFNDWDDRGESNV